MQITRGGAVIATVQADGKGAFEAAYKLPKGESPGALKFTAKGATSGKASNEGVLVVLAPRNAVRFSVYLPVVYK